jgi:hypothetical protein
MNTTTRIAVALALALGGWGQVHAQEEGPVPKGPAPGLEPPANAFGSLLFGVPAVFPWEGEFANALNAPIDASQGQWWLYTDYLLGFVRSRALPPLVSTSPQGTPRIDAGVLGQPGTSLLFGGNNVNGDQRSGIHFGGGAWFDAERTIGVDVGFYMLESRDALFFASSQGNPILARPFTDAVSGKQVSQLVAFPGVTTGSILGSALSDNFYSAYLDFQEVFLSGTNYRLMSVLGYRFYRFNEAVNMQQSLTSTSAPGLVPGTQVQTADNFTASNTFNGVEIGVKGEFYYDRWSLGAWALVALGDINRDINIIGSTHVMVPGETPVNSSGGMLALASNSGRTRVDTFSNVPELGFNVGWNITSKLRLRAGYSVLFWSNVARAADQIDTTINRGLFPPIVSTSPGRPAFTLQTTDMCVQSVNLGLEYRY